MEIKIDGIGVTHIEEQTSMSFIINGEEYCFTMIIKYELGGENDVDFVCDTDTPFEITEEMKSIMYQMVQEYE